MTTGPEIRPSPVGETDPDPARTETIMEKLLLTADEVASSLGVGRSRVYDLIRTRELPSVKIGRVRRVPAEAVRRFVAQLTEAGQS